ncbi:hypothetical protein [Acetobacterium bakii]|uniref:hypothetical protein n=1 Tax=Acetobacterium bakii TaxID=52689 RepID=UPI000F8E714D|nr:hypothetical protein [Acetobacterium bakii]
MTNRLACPIMQPTTIYHCPQDGFIDNLTVHKAKVSPGDNRNISCRHHGEQACLSDHAADNDLPLSPGRVYRQPQKFIPDLRY